MSSPEDANEAPGKAPNKTSIEHQVAVLRGSGNRNGMSPKASQNTLTGTQVLPSTLRERTAIAADLNFHPHPAALVVSAGSPARDSGMGGRIDIASLLGPADSQTSPPAKRPFNFEPEATVVRRLNRHRATVVHTVSDDEESGPGSVELGGGGAPKIHPAIRFPPGYQLAATREALAKASRTAPMPSRNSTVPVLLRGTMAPMSPRNNTAGGTADAPSTGKFPEPVKGRIEVEGESDSDVQMTGFNIRNGRDNVQDHDREKPIEVCGDRNYGEWFGTFRGIEQLVSGQGTLFPMGYQPREGDDNPWICPIRDCQVMFSRAQGLGSHFKAAHRRALLNDNGDRTMSVVGERPDVEKMRRPAIVISQIPIDTATASPIASPRVSRTRKAALQHWQARQDNPGPTNPGLANPSLTHPSLNNTSLDIANSPRNQTAADLKPRPTASTNSPINHPEANLTPPPVTSHNTSNDTPSEPLPLQSESAWRSRICEWLPENITRQENILLAELLSLPRLRDVPAGWEARFAHTALPDFKTLCLLLVYVTGHEAPSPCSLCARDGVASSRGFEGCIVLAEGRSGGLSQFFGGGCCNVFGMFCGGNIQPGGGASGPVRGEAGPGRYTDKKFAPPSDEEVDKNSSTEGGGSAAPEVVRQVSAETVATPEETAKPPNAEKTEEEQGGKEEKAAEVRRSGRLALREQNALSRQKEAEEEEDRKNAKREAEEEVARKQNETAPGGKATPPKAAAKAVAEKKTPSPKSPMAGSKSKRSPTKKPDARNAPANQGFGADLMAVETWEMAPGIIRDETGDQSEYVAFSSAYLASNCPVKTSDESAFRVQEIQPGGSLPWNVDKVNMRICSVARGIVRVKLGGTDEFQIGPNGMWKVKKGVQCSVMNPFHNKVVLHVTSVAVSEADWVEAW
ncbi:hypothetical protein B0T25DRAFT_601909 [Lasiosphaeria hispida]|uniref:C2H2-type domain-containing protein n=1 Tax=Lasiosphaeria hispida TaxID=260671 RepID=A0AAJ0HSF3_9PEZI|nr:hypothetical protein B0T25DRAFT_601909 [Lasiosphaeria hispida]